MHFFPDHGRTLSSTVYKTINIPEPSKISLGCKVRYGPYRSLLSVSNGDGNWTYLSELCCPMSFYLEDLIMLTGVVYIY